MKYQCKFSKANFWLEERLSTSSKQNPLLSMCCTQGRVKIAEIIEPPERIKSLLLGTHSKSKQFLSYIRAYNCTFA
jgi:hypothetical protein